MRSILNVLTFVLRLLPLLIDLLASLGKSKPNTQVTEIDNDEVTPPVDFDKLD